MAETDPLIRVLAQAPEEAVALSADAASDMPRPQYGLVNEDGQVHRNTDPVFWQETDSTIPDDLEALTTAQGPRPVVESTPFLAATSEEGTLLALGGSTALEFSENSTPRLLDLHDNLRGATHLLREAMSELEANHPELVDPATNKQELVAAVRDLIPDVELGPNHQRKARAARVKREVEHLKIKTRGQRLSRSALLALYENELVDVFDDTRPEDAWGVSESANRAPMREDRVEAEDPHQAGIDSLHISLEDPGRRRELGMFLAVSTVVGGVAVAGSGLLYHVMSKSNTINQIIQMFS